MKHEQRTNRFLHELTWLGVFLSLNLLTYWWFFNRNESVAADAIQVDLSQGMSAVPRQVHAETRPLRIAVAAMLSPKSTRRYYEGLLHYIGETLNQPVEIVQRKSYLEVSLMLERRELDFAFICSGPYVHGHDKFGLELLVAPVVKGEQVYHSLIIVRQGSAFKSLEDLRGQTFAFTDPDSNSGCQVPKYLLSQKGHNFKRFFAECTYTNSHDNSIKAVAKGTVAAAAVDSLIWEFTNQVDPDLTAQTHILMKSPPYGIPPVVIHPNVPAAKKQKLRQLFLNLHNHPLAKKILGKLHIDRFELANDGMYESVREVNKWLERNRE